MPLLAAGAVALCTAMVLIVWSVMGGFLVSLLASGSKSSGDVSISWPNVGFAHYEELIARLEKHPSVLAATPVIEAVGTVSLPDDRIEIVRVRGIDPESYRKVVQYDETLHWKPIPQPLEKDTEGKDPRLDPKELQRMSLAYSNGLMLTRPDMKTGRPMPAAVLGIEMCGLSMRQIGGWYEFRPEKGINSIIRTRADGRKDYLNGFMPEQSITIRLLPLDLSGRSIELTSYTFPVANEFRSGVYEIDRQFAMVPLGTLQRLLKMDAATRLDPTVDLYDPQGGQTNLVPVPARVTTVVVKAKEGVTPEALLPIVEDIYGQFAADHRDVPDLSQFKGRLIQTWAMSQARIVGAVTKETGLVLLLLSFISLTASFLILAIFWAMVSEKTKDVGILRAIGAGKWGVAWIWLRYGLVIGVIGSILGGALAYTIVTNINAIHDWMGANLGLVVWDPRVYYFSEIPRQINPMHAVTVLVGGVVLSLLGAVVPAWRAATMDPVRALRFE